MKLVTLIELLAISAIYLSQANCLQQLQREDDGVANVQKDQLAPNINVEQSPPFPLEEPPLSSPFLYHKQPLVKDDIAYFRSLYEQGEPKNTLASIVVSRYGLDEVPINSHVNFDSYHQFFSDEIKMVQVPSDQKATGRCWMFSGLNVLRETVIKRYGLGPDFGFSEAYLFFWDKLERANLLLERLIEHYLKHRVDYSDSMVKYHDLVTGVSFETQCRLAELLQGSLNDGGFWHMLVNLIVKYGLVPKTAYVESFPAGRSESLNKLLKTRIREWSLDIRDLILGSVASKESELEVLKNHLQKVKHEWLAEIYRMLVVAFGEPPSTFDWRPVTKDSKQLEWRGLTPHDMLRKHVDTAWLTMVSVANDPRHPYLSLYRLKEKRNMVDGLDKLYLNMPIAALKMYAIKMIKELSKPVWFACDVEKFFVHFESVLDQSVFDYEVVLGTKDIFLRKSKAERLDTYMSSLSHAMMITGVHLDSKTGLPVRWKVMNSWGTRIRGGYVVMSDAWFDEFVYEVIVDEKVLDQDALLVLNDAEPQELPYFDPLSTWLTA